tara:strand:- start:307 stop:1104 length:798 start_codon:yes stop_codon:yes gene_type:complete
MAETLTFDNVSEQQPTTPDNLSTEEQDSLQVGEQIQQQEGELLAGKYENAQQLEKAYIELQKKMGSDDKGEEEVSTEEEKAEPEFEVTPTVEALTRATDEFNRTGELTAETMAGFAEMDSKDLVDTYFKMAKYVESQEEQAPAVDLSETEVANIQNSVGGEAQYNQLLNWATDNVSADQMNAFDGLIKTGDANSIQLAINGLKAQYDNIQGYEGRMLTGKAPRTSGDVYRSQAEVVKAMSDPKYDDDPAYRQDVMEKLSRSDVQF